MTGLTKERVEEVLDEYVRPGLRYDGGDIEVLDIDTDRGLVKVHFVGACGGCPMSMMTLQMGVERSLRQHIPEIRQIVPI